MRCLKAFASVRRWPAVHVWNCSLNGKLNWNEIQVSKVSHIQMRKYTLIILLIWTLLTHALPLSLGLNLITFWTVVCVIIYAYQHQILSFNTHKVYIGLLQVISSSNSWPPDAECIHKCTWKNRHFRSDRLPSRNFQESGCIRAAGNEVYKVLGWTSSFERELDSGFALVKWVLLKALSGT